MPNCPFCDGPAQPLMGLRHTTVWRCRAQDCGLEFAWPQLDDTELNAAYAEFYYPQENGHAPRLEATPEDVLRQFLDYAEREYGPLAGQRLLDYGCGTGTLCRLAAEHGMKPVGIEQDPVARGQTVANSGCRAYGDVAALRDADPQASFDYITLWTVIEHLRRPWQTLQELNTVLAPEGHIFVVTPNAAGIKGVLLGSRWDQRTNPTHFYWFRPRSLAALLRRCGFEAVEPVRAVCNYEHHGPLRRQVQRLLVSLDRQGGLLFTARAAARRPLPLTEEAMHIA